MTEKLQNVEKSASGLAGGPASVGTVPLKGGRDSESKGPSCRLCSVALLVAWGQLRRNGRWVMRRMPCPECVR